MTDVAGRKLERILRRDGTLGDFVLMALEDLREEDLFRIEEATKRVLLGRSHGKAKNVESVEELRARLAEVPMRVTQRGFAVFEFSDRYGERCSLQESSLATEAAIWLGIDEPPLRVFAPKGAGFSTNLLFDNEHSGWATMKVNVDGGNVLQSGRMHITQDRLRALLPMLQRFAESGELAEVDEAGRMIRTLPDGQALRHGDDCPYCGGAGFAEDEPASQCPVCLGGTTVDLTDPDYMERFNEMPA